MENKYIVLDTETTGLNAAEDELLQVSIIDEEGNVLFDSYIRPTQHTEWAEAEHINHITPEMVADAPIIAEVMPEITDILKRYDKIVGYNVRFDADFLKNNGAEFADNTNFVDSMKIFSLYFSADNKRCKLTEAADYFCYDWSEHKEAHNSLGDCFATLYVYKKLTTDTMTIERVIDGKRVGIELTPAEISQAYCIKEYYDRKQDVLNVLDEMDSLKIGDIDLSKDFLKNSNTFIDDVIYRYEKMDDHLEDYNMAIKDVLDNADKNYANKLVSHYAQNMSAADKEQYIESAEMTMDWNDTNEPAISKIEHMVYEKLIETRSSENTAKAKAYIDNISKKCHNANDKCFEQSQNDIFLSDRQAVQAVKMGIPVGYVTKYAGYHGSSAALHTFYMLSEQNFSTLKNDKSMDKGPVFHYTLNDDQKKQLLNIVDTALKDPEYAKCLELPKKTTPMRKKSMGRK
ncbi:3'-5' exonuclease [Ruminococcus bicirculans]|uniref:3'-5' exonuclease n=1 Tax=Ruminococcus bicirculans (ex Wegman et al. 2014) TaxID=1160721 RepID=A0AAW6E6A3_9FIRM|nr:3'-5' exonuclease [Ruminococcus bicirculans (ex Wegman et al. 2014)]MDB8746018.1 3'-5' exonuclease [Ruminococcus bicirculans (ex Wegman et al. 2014)]MDB8748711.1 3'-5' exonuclease [Ruminococcus bicirculans (ex Wegman et al. 2014)]MDB8754056.1 3'-5' exonuclease [Ruminococcus bicirculans (ex Wegman et al. 2014)]